MTRATPSTAAVATVAGRVARRVVGLAALAPSATVVSGPAATCSCEYADNLALHRLLASAPAGSMLVCDASGDGDHAYCGELMALDARNRGLAGLVLDGAVRDAAALASSGWPVFHRGLAPAPCAKTSVRSVGEPVALSGVLVASGDVVVADRDAVLVVAQAEWPDVEARALALEADEDKIRAALARGERLGDLLGLDVETGS